MSPKRTPSDLKLQSIFDESLLVKVITNEQHRNKVWSWLILHPDGDINDIPFNQWSVPKLQAAKVKEDFIKFTTKIVERNESTRGDTTKLLLELQDGHRIETVIMRHAGHATVCVSSQIGCAMGCRFCATGTMGIIGDLTAGEILEQLIRANEVSKIRNVVFMGMGEPLNNFENVKSAVEFMVDNKRFGLSPKHITVSTVGVLKYMYRLTAELPHVNLALSLHAPNQTVRVKIVPAAGAHRLDKLMDAVDNHIKFNSKEYRTRGKKGSGNCVKKTNGIENSSVLASAAEKIDESTTSVATGTFSNIGSNIANTDANNNSKISTSHDTTTAIVSNNTRKFSVLEARDVSPSAINTFDISPEEHQTADLHSEDVQSVAGSVAESAAAAGSTRLSSSGVMIEYILIRDVNDLPEHAHELGALLAPRRENVMLNLIPYNPTLVAEDYFPPSEESVAQFHAICVSYRIHCRVRQEKGQDIDSACGQLALMNPNKKKEISSNKPVPDLEECDGVSGNKMAKSVTKSTVAAAGISVKTNKAALSAELPIAGTATVTSPYSSKSNGSSPREQSMTTVLASFEHQSFVTLEKDQIPPSPTDINIDNNSYRFDTKSYQEIEAMNTLTLTNEENIDGVDEEGKIKCQFLCIANALLPIFVVGLTALFGGRK